MGLINKFKSLLQSSLIGLDIGDSLIKLSEVEINKSNVCLNNVAIGKTPINSVSEGKIKDVEILGDKINSLLEDNNFASNRVVTAISGEEVLIRMVEVPEMPENELAEAVKWEAREQLPIPVDEAILDYEIINHKKEGGYKLMMVATKQDVINRYLKLFQVLDLEIVAIEIEPIAIVRSLKSSYPNKTMALIDMGTQTTDILVFKDGQLLFTRNIGIAGQNITKEISENYNMSFKEAEDYKKSNNLFGDADLNLIIRNLTTAIYRSLDYFQVKYKSYDIDKLILAGGGSKLLGFRTHLTNEFGIEVEGLSISNNIESKVERVNDQYLSEVAHLLGPSLGLALREAVQNDKFTTS
ncbi:type IV pilus assembly protein PilM [Selenihalanaerobacter shriftii]|uniref:Type IV pilus assembly protein PilM n=1 Tax=Selenihalanaerobacter shriftii TaxID=142842 RepID=A0A1T4P3T0_9FIRM|nr:type IV pilus assembly protein PilM [Selenihalanaerobacter shriftii]SJZ86109.1 type IV pilus assembly protein PilM [Selenihalanaerobacter shriftii]